MTNISTKRTCFVLSVIFSMIVCCATGCGKGTAGGSQNNRGAEYPTDLGDKDSLSRSEQVRFKQTPRTINNQYYHMGNYYVSMQDFEKALACYDKAIQSEPTLAEAYVNQGNVYSIIGKTDKALEIFSASIRLAPTSVAYYNRGLAYHRLKDYKSAISDYSEAIKLNSDYQSAYYNRGQCKRALFAYSEAMADFTISIRLDKSHVNSYLERGDMHKQFGNYAEAISDYEIANKLKPNDQRIAYVLMRTEQLAKDDQAIYGNTAQQSSMK